MTQGQQGGGNADDSLDILWTIGLVLVVGAIAWYMGGTAISKYSLIFKRAQLLLVRYWYAILPPIKLEAVGVDNQRTLVGILNQLDLIKASIGTKMVLRELGDIFIYVGSFWRFIYTPIALALAAYLAFGKRAAGNFRKVFNTATLRKSEQGNWPQITPVIKLDLVNTKLDDGPWAMSRSPMNYCKFHNLLIVNKNEQNGYDVKLDRAAAAKILEEQLGVKWQGIDFLPEHARALFAIFAARIAGDKKGAERLLDSISRSAGGDRLNFSGVEQLLTKYADHKLVKMVISKHAYVTTVMASMLEGARSIGVLASSEFIWLKPVDRRLWYMLNSVGRSTAVAEICGAFAHWVAELRNDGPLFAPMIGEAIKGLEIALSELIYHPDED